MISPNEELEQLLQRQEQQEQLLAEFKRRSLQLNAMEQEVPGETVAYDLHQRDEELFLSVDVPGVLEESLQFEIRGREFVIQGEHPLSEPDNAVCLQQNRPRGSFEYRFLLPHPATHFESYQDRGVLYLRLQLQSPE